MDFASFRDAQVRIKPHIRVTPLLDADSVRRPVQGVARLALKAECLQVTGSFKVRGALNRALMVEPERRARGLVTASGGNHGLGVAHAAFVLGATATVVLPSTAPLHKEEALRGAGAVVMRVGDVWDEADRFARALAEDEGAAYIHPFAHPQVIAGQGTVGVEVLAQRPSVDVIVVPIGGGGFIGGVAAAIASRAPHVRVIGVEPEGAPTMHASLAAGALVALPSVQTRAGTLAPLRTTQRNLDLARTYVERVVLVSDDEMTSAARWLWSEHSLAVELAGAAATAALRAGKVPDVARCDVVAMVCGAGQDGFSPR